jgi:hypothetical protein
MHQKMAVAVDQAITAIRAIQEQARTNPAHLRQLEQWLRSRGPARGQGLGLAGDFRVIHGHQQSPVHRLPFP